MADQLTEETGRRIADALDDISHTTRSPNLGNNTPPIDRTKLDTEEFTSRQRFTSGTNTLSEVFGKLAAGSMTTGDAFDAASTVMNKFGTVTGTVGDIFNQLGKAAISVNETLKETGRYGITFGNDLGEANLAIKDAHLTLGEFANVVAQNSQTMAGLGSTMDKSAKAYLQVLSDVTTSEVGRDLRAMGMSAREMAEITQLSMSRKRLSDYTDEKSKQELVESAARMAEEFTLISEITGKNRKQLMDEQRKAMEATEVLAATLKYGSDFKAKLDAATSELSPALKRAVIEQATGGVRTEEGMSIAASLGPAMAEVRKLSEAVKSGDADEIKKRTIELQAATAKQIEEQAHSTMILGDTYYSHGRLLQENYGYVQSIADKQEEMRKKGQEISKEEAHRMLEREGKLKRAGLDEEGKIKEGAIAGRAINQVDYLGKVAGSVAAEGLKQLNTGLGHAAKDSIPAFEKALNDFATRKQVIRKVEELGEEVSESVGLKGWKSSTEQASEAQFPQREGGSLGATGTFIEDFGKGTLVELHGKEAVLTEEQFSSLFNFVNNGTNKNANLDEYFTPESPIGKEVIAQNNSLSQDISKTLKDLGVTTFGQTTSNTDVPIISEENVNQGFTLDKNFSNINASNTNLSDQVQNLSQVVSEINTTDTNQMLQGLGVTTFGQRAAELDLEKSKSILGNQTSIIDQFFSGIGSVNPIGSTRGLSQSISDIVSNVMTGVGYNAGNTNQTQMLEQYFSGGGFSPKASIESLINSFDKSISRFTDDKNPKSPGFFDNIADAFYDVGNVAGKAFDDVFGGSTKTKPIESIKLEPSESKTKPVSSTLARKEELEKPISPLTTKSDKMFDQINDLVNPKQLTKPSDQSDKKLQSLPSEKPIAKKPDGFFDQITDFFNPKKESTKETQSSIASLGPGADAAALKAKYSNISNKPETVSSLPTDNTAINNGKAAYEDAVKSLTPSSAITNIKDPLAGKLDLSSTIKDWQSTLASDLKTERTQKDESKPLPEKTETEIPLPPTPIEPTKTTDATAMSDIKDELIRLNSSVRELINYTGRMYEGINQQVKATKGISGNLLS